MLVDPLNAQPYMRLSRESDYKKFVEPLLAVKDFGVSYADDGAADASVLAPRNGTPVRPEVLAIIGLGPKAFPLLIDCLGDLRVSSAVFEGNNLTKRMNVPLGFVCLDLLLATANGPGIHYKDCADDGLGACVDNEYYFWPNEYKNCWNDICIAQHGVFLVQRNWRRIYVAGKLRYQRP